MIDTDAIIHRFYDPGSTACRVLMEHSRCVADKACRIADRVSHLSPDRAFIEEAALLHDIGMIRTQAPAIGCQGEQPYLFHGVLGRDMLDGIDLPRHGLVAERHILTGITKDAIVARNLGLPLRDMVPVTLEEIIVCYADIFFSKTPGALDREKTVDDILGELSRYGGEHVLTFRRWLGQFGN